MTLQDLLSSYDETKLAVPSYRLGQHVCNTMKLRTEHTLFGKDLFLISDDKEASDLFLRMCEQYCWDVSDLPMFKNK